MRPTRAEIANAVADGHTHYEHHSTVDECSPDNDSRKRVRRVLEFFGHVCYVSMSDYIMRPVKLFLPAASAPNRGATLATIPIKHDNP